MKSHGEAFLVILLTIFAFEFVDIWNFGRLEFFVTLVFMITLKLGLLRRFVGVQDEMRKNNVQNSNKVTPENKLKTGHEDKAIEVECCSKQFVIKTEVSERKTEVVVPKLGGGGRV